MLAFYTTLAPVLLPRASPATSHRYLGALHNAVCRMADPRPAGSPSVTGLVATGLPTGPAVPTSPAVPAASGPAAVSASPPLSVRSNGSQSSQEPQQPRGVAEPAPNCARQTTTITHPDEPRAPRSAIETDPALEEGADDSKPAPKPAASRDATAAAAAAQATQVVARDEPAVVGNTTPARRVRIIYSDAFLEHASPRGSQDQHPERPERLRVCVDALRKDPRLVDALDWVEPTPVDLGTPRRNLVMECIREVHTYPDYLEELEEKSKNGGGWIDGDTYITPGSFEIALLAVSAWLDAVDYALSDEGGPVWALVRPPGHHATRVTGMGFCLLSNAAISAYYALRKVGYVGIIDFDVHHGNGTEHAVKDEPRIRFTSSHQYPLFPGTGDPQFTGPHNTILNVPLDEGTGMDTYRDIFNDKMLPHALFHSEPVEPPGLIIVSAGFDTLDVDPLASLEFKVADFEEICESIVSATSATANHERIILGLEGGYNLGPNGLGAAIARATCGLAGV
jgi:acetoin utilization deacetylase AcuC-like enzyme